MEKGLRISVKALGFSVETPTPEVSYKQQPGILEHLKKRNKTPTQKEGLLNNTFIVHVHKRLQ